MNKKSKIYVAGHNGLVGAAIINLLREKGYNNLIYKSHRELDLLNQEATEHFFLNERPEYVFVAAAKVGGIIANNTYRADFIYENLQIQNNIIHNSWKYEVKKLLFLGSTCIYPKDSPQPIKEDYLLTAPLEYTNEPYAIAKIAGIKMCESFNLQYGTNFISAMPTNLYGPNDNFDLEKSHVLPALLRKIHLGKCIEENNWNGIIEDFNKRPVKGIYGDSKKNELLNTLNKFGLFNSKKKVQIEIWGTGKPMREFLWSEDLADACIYIMKHINFCNLVGKHPNIQNTHINIGTGKEINIRSLAEMIKSIVGFKGKFKYNTTKPDGTFRKLTDATKLNKLGWKHQIEIEEGIKKLYNWYIEN